MRARTDKWHRAGMAMLAAVMALGAVAVGTSSASAFGALAVGDRDGYGFSYNYGTEREARARAQKECGDACQVVVVYQNTCAAFAADKVSRSYGYAYAPTKEKAQELATGYCSKGGATQCGVRVWACESKIKHDRTATAKDVIGDAYRGPVTATAQVAPPVSPPSKFSADGDDLRRTGLSPTQPTQRTETPRADPPSRPATTTSPVATIELPKPPATAPISGLPNDGTRRVALVIGNDRYETLPALQKAVNDSRSIGDTLTRLGFEVVRVENAPRRVMNQKLVEFTGKIGRGDTAFFFYAGHGVEIRGVNYLLPIDTPAAHENEEGLITGEGIPADSILERLQDRGAKVSLMVLDACRENPFKKAGSRGVGATRGLAQMTTPEGVFVLYSAGVGQTALDRLSDNDPNPNSVFTRAFIDVLSKPNESIQSMAKTTQQEVRRLAATVNHPQMPAYYDQILGQFSLAPAK